MILKYLNSTLKYGLHFLSTLDLLPVLHGSGLLVDDVPTTGPNGAVAKSSANRLIDTGFASPVQSRFLKIHWIGVCLYICVCMYVCVCVCVYVCMYVAYVCILI